MCTNRSRAYPKNCIEIEKDLEYQCSVLKVQYSSIAQSVEHSAVNRSVVGSSPTWGADQSNNFDDENKKTVTSR